MDVFKLKRFTDEGLLTDDIRAEQLISPLAVDNEHRIFMCDDKTLGFCFECQPLTGGGEKEHEKLDQLFSQNFPSNMTMSFLLFRSPDIEETLLVAERMRMNHKHPLLTPVFEERMRWLRKHTDEEIVGTALNGAVFNVGRVVDLKLIVSVKIPFSGEEPSEDDMEDCLDWATKIISVLKSVGFAPYQMDANRYVRFVNTFLNWNARATWRQGYRPLWEKDKPIPPQCFDPDSGVMIANPNFFTLGEDAYVKVLSAKKMPEAMYFGNAIDYVGDLHGNNGGIHQNYAVCCNIIFPDVSKMKGTLEKKRTWANNQAFGPLLKFDPILGDIKKSFDTIYDSLNNGSRPLKTSFHVIVFGKSEKEVTSTASAAESFWSDQHFTLKEDRYVMLPIFKNCLPLCCDRFAISELWRYKTMTSREVPVILPLFGEAKGTGTPHVELLSRNGQVMSLSLHDSSTNQNGVIAAESGSGKSFLLNELILSYMSEGARVWVIDAGKSYKKLCESLDGDFVEFSDRSKISLNPFETIVNWNDEEDAVVNLVGTMASMEGKLDDYQIAALKGHMHQIWNETYEEGKKQVQGTLDAINAAYEHKIEQALQISDRRKADAMVEDLERKRDLDLMQAMPPSTMSIDLIAERCLGDSDPRVRDVGVQLGSFTSKSSYGRFFSGHNNANFKNDLTVLELDELQGRKHLRQVVLLQLISQIQREIFLGERDRKKIVIIDEAWDLLKEGEVSVFMEHAYRKFRKYGGSAIIATQSVQDLYGNSVGKAISSNSANMFLLGQKPTTLEQVRKDNQLVMEDWAFNMLKSVHTEAGVFSEIFVSVGQLQCVGRLIVSDFQKLLYSTAPNDVNDIKQYQSQGMGIQDAINAVLRDREARRRY